MVSNKTKLFIVIASFVFVIFVAYSLSTRPTQRELRISRCVDIVLANNLAVHDTQARAICRLHYDSTSCEDMEQYYNEECEEREQERIELEQKAAEKGMSVSEYQSWRRSEGKRLWEEGKQKLEAERDAIREANKTPCLALVEQNINRYWKENCEKDYSLRPAGTGDWHICKLPKDLHPYVKKRSSLIPGEKKDEERSISVNVLTGNFGYRERLLSFCQTQTWL